MGQGTDADVITLHFVLLYFCVTLDFPEPLRVPGGFIGLPMGTVKVALKEREGAFVTLAFDPAISALLEHRLFGISSRRNKTVLFFS